MAKSAKVRLAQYREKELGESVARFAKRLGCSEGMVRHLESGFRRPGLRLALAIQKLTEGWADHRGKSLQINADEWEGISEAGNNDLTGAA